MNEPWRSGRLLRRALAIQESALGKNHSEVADTLDTLATLYRVQGKGVSARPLYERALAINEAALGKNHPGVARVLHNFATLYESRGDYERAEPLLLRSHAIWEETLGAYHPHVASSLQLLAQLRLGQHRLAEALPPLTRAFGISEQRLRHEALDFSEARLASFLQLLRADEEQIYSLLRMRPEDAQVRRLALSAVLRVSSISA